MTVYDVTIMWEISAKGYARHFSEDFFANKNLKMLCHLNGEEVVGTFYKKELQKGNQRVQS